MASWETLEEPSWVSAVAADQLDPGELDFNTVSSEFAGDLFVEMLVDLKIGGTISAKVACTLAFWASKAGAVGPACDLAVRPNQASGEFSRHFDKWTGSGARSMTTYPVPMARRMRFEASRRWTPLPMNLLSMALSEELSAPGNDMAAKLAAAVAAKDLPAAYFSHDAVRSSTGLVHPYSIYMDAVPFTRTDSILGIFAQLLLSDTRHLLFSVRKTEMCGCGCKGLCTLQPMFEAMAWDCETMLRGTWPLQRHDGRAFGDGEDHWSRSAGQDLGFSAVCCCLKADWMEWVHTLGLPTWKDTNNPCPLCFATTETLHETRGFSPCGMPAPKKTMEHYEAACAACEIRTVLQPADVPLVRARLEYEKRQGQSRGRVLQEDLPQFGLLKGDRLAATVEHPNIASLAPEEAPRVVLWWRKSNETVTRFRNPLFRKGTGVTLDTVGIDWLHALSLGVMQEILGFLIWRLFTANAFRVPGVASNVADLSLQALRQALGEWYSSEARAGIQHTRIENITMGMLGSAAAPSCDLHGAETNGMLAFAHGFLLPRFGHLLGADRKHFVAGIGSLVTILAIIRKYPRVVPPRDVQQFCDEVLAHLRAAQAINLALKPKHHILMEMGARLWVR